MKDGRMVRLTLVPGDMGREQSRVLVVPAGLVDEEALDKVVVKEVSGQGGNTRIGFRIKGKTEVVRTN